MFTGIIEELGRLARIDEISGGARIVVEARKIIGGIGDGDSVAVNGVCLTALDVAGETFAAELSQETLDRTTLGNLRPGARLNLERAVTPTTRLGGHIVQGHVDARGKLAAAENLGDFWNVRIGFPAELAKYLVYKGSVCVEGISLTIAALGDCSFDIAVIPKTWEVTNLSTLVSGDAVNIEVDVIAKYVERLVRPHAKVD